MTKIFSFTLISLMLTMCHNNQNIVNNYWIYKQGYYVGDVINFKSVKYKLNFDTIFIDNTQYVIIEKVTKKYLYIKSNNDSIGIYSIQ